MPRGDSTIPSIFRSRKLRARSSKRSAWRRRSALGEVADREPGPDVPDHDQPPGLHQPDGRGVVRRQQQAVEHLVGGRVRTETPDVPPLGDHPVHHLALLRGVPPSERISGALARARRVEARRRRWSREALLGRHERHSSPRRGDRLLTWTRAAGAGGARVTGRHHPHQGEQRDVERPLDVGQRDEQRATVDRGHEHAERGDGRRPPGVPGLVVRRPAGGETARGGAAAGVGAHGAGWPIGSLSIVVTLK